MTEMVQSMVEIVGLAIDRAWGKQQDLPPIEFTIVEREALARAAIEEMRARTLVFRQDGQVVHELRGAPDDIWKTLLDAALAEDTGNAPPPAEGD